MPPEVLRNPIDKITNRLVTSSGCRRPKGRNFQISASGYRVFCSGDCTMVKGRKGQHGVGLALKEEIVKNAGEDGITIECISARLLKARVSIESDFLTIVLAYTPTEEAPEG